MRTTTRINIIPAPQQTQIIDGHFTVNAETAIFYFPDNPELKAIGNYLSKKINVPTGFDLKVAPGTGTETIPNSILLTIKKGTTELNDEGYQLLVNKTSIEISASQPAGLFYGVQTLRQLLPPEIESPQPIKQQIAWTIPGVRIEDRPRFGWRGMLLDCCRHFMTKDFVKRYIDLLAYHKMNRLHWHLTEDQGWRIEIKKYPKLTELGAWRKYEDGTIHGGFYSQEDVKEIVEYAKSRYITVIPEIELPGHSVAALACYPKLSCTGEPFEVSTRWGVHKDVYCAGNDSTFEFLQHVLSEVVVLFPAPYIHIGGDEVPKDRWKKCVKCQARIKAEGLKDEHELQSYFIKRIEQFLLTKNRRIIGWDEILEGGLAPEATVQSWRGMKGAVTAAKSGHDAIVSPTSHAYFDYDIRTTDLRQVYSFEPVPPDLTEQEAKHILGGECNMWTEYAPQETIDSKMFPRMLAMAEVLWSPAEGKNFSQFLRRVRQHYQRLNLLGVNYGPESRPITILPDFDASKNQFKIILESGEEDLQIRYTLNGSDPVPGSKLYQEPFILSETARVKARAFRDGEPYGEIADKKFIFHLASGKPAKLAHPFSPKYTGGGNLALSDGITGSTNFRDGFWQGFEQHDLEAVIDLKKITNVHRIVARFLQNTGAWIFLPHYVEFSVSEDGETFTTVARLTNDVPTDNPEKMIKKFKQDFNDMRTRFIKVFAKNIGVCPPGHPGEGGKAWIFVDEIVIQ